MTPTTVTVTFTKAVSDNNYGSEKAEVTVTAEPGEGDYRLVVAALLSQARAAVQSELKQSPNLAVRRAIERQEPRQPQPDEL